MSACLLWFLGGLGVGLVIMLIVVYAYFSKMRLF